MGTVILAAYRVTIFTLFVVPCLYSLLAPNEVGTRNQPRTRRSRLAHVTSLMEAVECPAPPFNMVTSPARWTSPGLNFDPCREVEINPAFL